MTCPPPYQTIRAMPIGLDQLDDRIEDRVVEDRVDVRVAVPRVQPVELLRLRLLAVEELHRGHAGDVLLQEGVDRGDARPRPGGR